MTQKDKLKARLHRQISRRCKSLGPEYWRQYRAEIHRLHDKIAWNEVDAESTTDNVLLKRECLDELMEIAIVKLTRP